MSAKNLSNSEQVTELERRLGALRPDSPRQWGRMSPHQAVCHLSDSLRVFLGEAPVPPRRDNWFTRNVIRCIALHTPLAWPHGTQTVQGLDQVAGEGTPSAKFETDREEYLRLQERFAALGGLPPVSAHPIFGPLNREEWMVWAYRHADHHLRQFDA